MRRRLKRSVEGDAHRSCRRSPNLRASGSRSRSSAKVSATRACPARPSARRRAGLPISASSARASASGSFSSTSSAGLAVAHQLRDRRDARRHAGESLALRLHQHVRQAVAVAVASRRGWRARTGRPCGIRASSSSCVSAPRQVIFSLRPRALARCWRRSLSGPPPTCTKRQCSSGEMRASASSSTSVPFFSTSRATDRITTGSAASRHRGAEAAVLREPREIEAVIDQLDASRRRERGEVLAVRRGAGDQPVAARQLLALLPFRRGPDVLGVRRAAPRQPAQQRGIARRPKPACAGNAHAAASRPRGSSAASTSAWPKRRMRFGVGSRARSRSQSLRVAVRSCSRRMCHQARNTRNGSRNRYSGRYSSGARISSCTGWRRASVGWRSETMRISSPRRSSAAISCAMKVSERRG